jgi:urease beta subunit
LAEVGVVWSFVYLALRRSLELILLCRRSSEAKEILDRRQIGATFFVPGFTAERHPDAVRAIRDAGHEIAHHGYLHERVDGTTEAVRAQEGEVELAPGRERRRLTVRSESERPVRVSSHFPLWRTNARLAFDREAARGFRLDVPAGSSVRWAPGETKEVGMVRYGGKGGE